MLPVCRGFATREWEKRILAIEEGSGMGKTPKQTTQNTTNKRLRPLDDDSDDGVNIQKQQPFPKYITIKNSNFEEEK